ncbi:hypothetical protein [Aeromonas sp. sif2416]|uniref:hypothetical protein n=1 Tax=Aeromonas sp. sif2416 TaxID=2854793 RepID=UPI001C48B479|nr:hypothetical protein [Aeromonas sp. sif2416]MBV7437743.1 hypothetical protein [Aeromonas sp. sif2416]
MCPSIAPLGDIGIGHNGFLPSPVIAVGPDVFLDDKSVSHREDLLVALRPQPKCSSRAVSSDHPGERYPKEHESITPSVKPCSFVKEGKI